MSTGLQLAGFRVLAGVDNDPVALRTFARNHPGAQAICVDLTEYDPKDLLEALALRRGELECLIGGPPCQGFSKNVPRRERFLEDPRNQLVRRFLEFVRALRPTVIVMENVAEMVNGYNGAYTEEVLRCLKKYGYEASVRVLHAPDYGIPQRRRRAFFFAYLGGKTPTFPQPNYRPSGELSSLFSEQPYVTVWDAIGDLPRLNHGEGKTPCAYDRPPTTDFQRWARRDVELLYDHVARRLRDRQLARLAAIGPGEGAKHLPDELKPNSHYSGAYGKLDPDALAPTITRWVFHPGSGRFGHPTADRVITIREAARLQSFPDSFVFEGTYIQKSHQVGNAVPPLLINSFAPTIRRLLSA
jgi:DNA (cytosine-5)-methyltransferase 1